MATRRWTGDAKSVVEVKTVQITAYDAATTYILTINGKQISVLGTTDASGTAAALSAAWNASLEPEAAEITASVVTDTVTLTHDTTGVPFTVASSVSGGTGTIGAVSTTTAATGPNFWDDADNWSGDTVPVDTDDVVFDFGSVSVLYGLDQSAISLTSFKINKSYSGTIGLPESNANGYSEYRDTYLKIDSASTEIGAGDGNGSGRIKIAAGTVVCEMTIMDTGQSVENGIPAVLFKSGAANNIINVLKGSLGVAIFAGETAQIVTLRTSYLSSVAGDVLVQLGTGVTITNVKMSGGSVKLRSASTLIDMTNGDLEIFNGAHTELNIDGGTCYYRSTGTLTQGRVGSDGELHCTRDIRGRTFTDLELNERSGFDDSFKTVTFTNPIDLPRTGVEKLKFLRLGDHYTIQRGSI